MNASKQVCRQSPSLRAFVTWAHWSDSFRGSIASATNPNAVHGSAIGVQMETWW